MKGENPGGVTSGPSDPVTFSPGAGVWVTHYKTRLSAPSPAASTAPPEQLRVSLGPLLVRASDQQGSESTGTFPTGLPGFTGNQPAAQQLSSAVGVPSKRGPKAHFISFQTPEGVCRLLQKQHRSFNKSNSRFYFPLNADANHLKVNV